jgi:hypothetical protein
VFIFLYPGPVAGGHRVKHSKRKIRDHHSVEVFYCAPAAPGFDLRVVSLPQSLVAQVDEASKRQGIASNLFIQQALEAALGAAMQ